MHRRLTSAALLVPLVVAAWAAPAFADYVATGRFQYEDRQFGLEGFTGAAIQRPIRYADVRIVSGNATLATGSTGEDGSYSILVSGPEEQAITAVCVSTSTRTPGLLLDLRVATDSYGFGDYYAVASATQQSPASGSTNFGTVTAEQGTEPGTAFNIWDVLNDSMQFVASNQLNRRFPDTRLTVIWRRTHSRTGSFYQGGGTSKYMFVGSTAGADDTVISHEFGHFLDDLYSKSDSPGGTHYIGDSNQDMRLAWSEGLATFLGSSMRRFKEYQRPDIYVSTDGVRLNFSYDLETLSEGRATISSKTGSANEIAVSAALWDILDDSAMPDGSPGGDDDSLARPFSDIWRTLTGYFPAVTSAGITLETFWDGWFSPQINNGALAEMRQIFADLNGIEFVPDTDEPDDAAAAPLLPTTPLPAISGAARVRISEVDLGIADSIELYNAGGAEADLSGWTVEAGAPGYETAVFELPPFRLGPGAFVILSENGGTNTNSVLYFTNNISWSNGADGACTLRDSSGIAVDFVRWGKSKEPVPAQTAFTGTAPQSPASGSTLARDYVCTDTDAGSDWTPQVATAGSFNLSGVERHRTFYPGGDVDRNSFTAVAGHSYLVETLALENGADTVLEVVGPDGNSALAVNDDFGPGKSSRVVWTATTGGRHLVRVRRFDGPSNLARYGSYDVRIVESSGGFGLAVPEKLTVSRQGQGGGYQRLSEAVQAAVNGDTIEILDSGVYEETVFISGKSVNLRAAPGKSPVIDGRKFTTSATMLVSGSKTVTIEGVTILAGSRGIRIGSGNVTIRNSVVTGASDVSGFSDGIQVVGLASSLNLVNCTVVNNRRLGVGVFNSAKARIVNSILRGNAESDIDGDGSATSLLVRNSFVGTGTWAGTNGNIAGDPRFSDASDGDYRLRSDSPCIDSGDFDPDLPATDADGIPRTLDGNGDGQPSPDMGAYEHLSQGLLSSLAVFPQIATGGVAPEYRTTIVAINPGAATATASVSLVRSDATPLSLESARRADGVVNFPIPPGGLSKLEATLKADTTAGYAKVRSSLPVSGTALFRAIRDGRVVSEAGVGLSRPSRVVNVYIDSQGNANSGYAVANFADQPAFARLTLRDRNGSVVDTSSITLRAGQHLAEFAFQRFGAVVPGFEGSVRIESDQPLAAVALRFDNTTVDVFSTIPVLSDEAATTLYFPQVADGGSYRTAFILVNPSNIPASARFEFFGSDGSPVAFPVSGSPRTSWNVPVSANGVARFITDGTSPAIQAGWVRVTATSPLGGSAIFQTVRGNRIESEAGVANSPAGTRFLVHVESTGDAESGFALSNPNQGAVTLRLNLRNAAGQVVASTDGALPPRGHLARFFTQWFPEGFGEFEGTLEVISSSPICAVGLRYDNPLADVFATLPVIPVP